MKEKWAILIAGAIVSICTGTGFAWGVYQIGLFNEGTIIFGAEVQKSQLALAFTVCSGVAPIPIIAGNGLRKEFKGPRNVVWLGGILFNAGLICTSLIHSLTMLYVTYELFYGFGTAFAYGVTTGNTARFFPDKRGLIAGISTAAYGTSSIIFPPIMQSLIGSDGAIPTFRVLGILFGVMIITATCFIAEPPEGWLPTDWTPPAVKNSSGTSAEGKNWKLMLTNTEFYLVIIASTIFTIGDPTAVSQGSPMAQAVGGMDAAVAATTVSIIGLVNTRDRVFWEWISDKVGRYPTLSTMAVIAVVSGFALSAFTEGKSLALFLVPAMLIAMCYGGSMGVYPALTADTLGIKYNGVNYGIMLVGFTLGGYVGPILTNNLYDNAGSYSVPLMVVDAMGVVALIILLALTTVRKQARR